MKSFVLLLVCTAFILTASLTAQTTDFEKGIVVTKKGDTLFGLVKDRSEEPFGKLYKKIRLKVDGKLFTKTFRPSAIKSYQKGSAYFESVWIMEKSEFFKTTYISQKGVGDKVFMKVILKGRLTYYQWEWRDPDSGYYHYIPLFKKQDSPTMVRVTQGLFGLRRESVAKYLEDNPDLAKRIRSGENLSAYDISRMYNQ